MKHGIIFVLLIRLKEKEHGSRGVVNVRNCSE
jgi:hypothetical protein